MIISLIEIYLKIRASFFSRVKEVGKMRAIGVKKSDVNKMFVGEIFVITSLASVLGIILSAYIFSFLENTSVLSSVFCVNIYTELAR